MELKDLHPGGRIQALRERRGISQKQLADAVGAHVMTVSKWERGVLVPRRRAALAIAKALKVSPEAITDGLESVSRETGDAEPSPDLSRELGKLADADMDEWQRTWRLEALAAAFRADALREAERAATIRAGAMREAELASGERARAATAAERAALARAEIEPSGVAETPAVAKGYAGPPAEEQQRRRGKRVG